MHQRPLCCRTFNVLSCANASKTIQTHRSGLAANRIQMLFASLSATLLRSIHTAQNLAEEMKQNDALGKGRLTSQSY